MLWPPPIKADRVELRCGCRATIVWRVPVVVLYWVRIDRKGRDCARRGHASGRHWFAFLEAVTSRLS